MIEAGTIIELGAKSLVVTGIALVLLRLATRRTAAERSWIAHLGLLALVLLPAAVWLMPGWNPLPESFAASSGSAMISSGDMRLPQVAGVDSATPETAPAAVRPRETVAAGASFAMASAADLAVWIYAIPAILLLLAILVAVVRLGTMQRRANVLVESSWLSALALAQRRMGFKHGTALLVSKDLPSPVSWGLMRPIILLNEKAVEATGEAEAIIAHELAHVARLDWAKLLLARVACALFWFNPLVWWLAREAHQLREEAADDAVLLSEVDGAEYASLLVNAARHDNHALLMAAHGVAPGRNSLKRRITRVLDANQARGPANAAWIAICLLALVGGAAPLAAFNPLLRNPTVDPLSIGARADGLHEMLPSPLTSAASQVRARAIGTELAPSRETEAEESTAQIDRDREIEDLIAYKSVQMTPQYMSEIRNSGFPRASMEDLTGAKAVGVTPDFVRQVRQWDDSASLEDVIEAKAVGLSAEYFEEMRPLVGGDFEDIVKMAALQVSPGYVREMRSLFGAVDAEAITELKALDVTGNFVRQMRELFPNLDADAVVDLKGVGVTPEFVREMRRQGLPVGDPDEAVEGRLFLQRSGGKNAKGTDAAAFASTARGPTTRPGPNIKPGPRGAPPGLADN